MEILFSKNSKRPHRFKQFLAIPSLLFQILTILIVKNLNSFCSTKYDYRNEILQKNSIAEFYEAETTNICKANSPNLWGLSHF